MSMPTLAAGRFPVRIATAGGVIAAAFDTTAGNYPGISILIDNTIAAVVEWHETEQCLVLRTYNDHNDDPQHYHRWDGTSLLP